jgi:hypothetical protein
MQYTILSISAEKMARQALLAKLKQEGLDGANWAGIFNAYVEQGLSSFTHYKDKECALSGMQLELCETLGLDVETIQPLLVREAQACEKLKQPIRQE